MNVEMGTVAAQCLFREYLFRIFVPVSVQLYSNFYGCTYNNMLGILDVRP